MWPIWTLTQRVYTVGITGLEHHCRKTDINDPLLNVTWLRQDKEFSFPSLWWQASFERSHILRTDLSCLMLNVWFCLCISVWKTTFPSNSFRFQREVKLESQEISKPKPAFKIHWSIFFILSKQCELKKKPKTSQKTPTKTRNYLAYVRETEIKTRI